MIVVFCHDSVSFYSNLRLVYTLLAGETMKGMEDLLTFKAKEVSQVNGSSTLQWFFSFICEGRIHKMALQLVDYSLLYP